MKNVYVKVVSTGYWQNYMEPDPKDEDTGNLPKGQKKVAKLKLDEGFAPS
jgi:hypothetical protein